MHCNSRSYELLSKLWIVPKVSTHLSHVQWLGKVCFSRCTYQCGGDIVLGIKVSLCCHCGSDYWHVFILSVLSSMMLLTTYHTLPTHTCALHVHVSCLTTYHTLLIHTHTHMYRDHPSIAHVRPTKSGDKRPHQNITVSQVISPCRDVPTPASEHMLGYKRGKSVRFKIATT